MKKQDFVLIIALLYSVFAFTTDGNPAIYVAVMSVLTVLFAIFRFYNEDE